MPSVVLLAKVTTPVRLVMRMASGEESTIFRRKAWESSRSRVRRSSSPSTARRIRRDHQRQIAAATNPTMGAP
jgi:hypothetical protein